MKRGKIKLGHHVATCHAREIAWVIPVPDRTTSSVPCLRVRYRRSSRGVYMLELLIALAVSSLLAAALVGNMAETSELSNAGENQLMAATIAQLLIDNTRN